MVQRRFTCLALALCAAITGTAGCNGNQSIVAPRDGANSGSWMSPEASGDTLLYITDGFYDVYALAYPSGKLVGTLSGISHPIGVCSDASGNVFVTAYYTQDVVEYAHGGTTPIAKLPDFGYRPRGCAVDPVTGNLAVANNNAMDGSQGNVAVYAGAKGKPTDYSVPSVSGYSWCAYDASGDLFVNGAQLDELRAGSQSLEPVSLNVTGQGLQWDGTYVAMIDPSTMALYRISVTGSSGKVVGTTHFKGLIFGVGDDFELAPGKAVVPYEGYRPGELTRIGFWKYPRGGQHGRSFKAQYGVYALALSY